MRIYLNFLSVTLKCISENISFCFNWINFIFITEDVFGTSMIFVLNWSFANDSRIRCYRCMAFLRKNVVCGSGVIAAIINNILSGRADKSTGVEYRRFSSNAINLWKVVDIKFKFFSLFLQKGWTEGKYMETATVWDGGC